MTGWLSTSVASLAAWVALIERARRARGVPAPAPPASPAHVVSDPAPRTLDYARWVEEFDRLTQAECEAIERRVEELSRAPVISVAMPVCDPDPEHLRRALASVRRQLYPRWQLCLADDASSDPRVVALLEATARNDPRVALVRRRARGGIAAASNDALSLATGAFVAFLDHDDELAPHALYEMAEALEADPALDLLYSDEDKIDERGERREPHFKPDFDPDLLRAQNYVGHLLVVRRSLVESVGGLRPALDGAQDHDLVLRVCERSAPGRIRHLPQVLYHWRVSSRSTASSPEAKPYARRARLRAVREHLARIGARADAQLMPNGFVRVRHRIEGRPRVSVVIPTRDRADLLRQALDGVLRRTSWPDLEVLVVDNGSVEPATRRYLDEVARDPRVRVLRLPGPFNYSRLNNRAVAESSGELLCLLNNDVEVTDPGWLEEMVAHALRPDVGVVGALLLYPDGRIQHAGVLLGVGGVAAHRFLGRPRGFVGPFSRATVAQSVSAVTGACQVMRRAVFEEVGGLDEEHLPVAFNDIDLCLRMQEQGRRVVWTPCAVLHHHESASRGRDLPPDERVRSLREIAWMHARWGERLTRDPHHNPNLSFASPDATEALAAPPRERPPWRAARHSTAAPPPDLPAGVAASVRFAADSPSLRSATGSVEGRAVVCRRFVHRPGHVLFGPNVPIERAGRYEAVFRLAGEAGAALLPFVTLDVYDSMRDTVLAERVLRGNIGGHVREVGLAFGGRPGQRIELRAWWHGQGVLRIEEVRLEWIEGRAGRPAFGAAQSKASAGSAGIAARGG